METMCYYSESSVDLQQIKHLADTQNYRTDWLPEHFFGYVRLNIYYGSDRHDWWQWYAMSLDKMWFDSEAERDYIKSLKPGSSFLFEYYQTSLSEIAVFMDVIMQKYGGWVDCKGDSENLYTRETLHNIIDNCP